MIHKKSHGDLKIVQGLRGIGNTRIYFSPDSVAAPVCFSLSLLNQCLFVVRRLHYWKIVSPWFVVTILHPLHVYIVVFIICCFIKLSHIAIGRYSACKWKRLRIIYNARTIISCWSAGETRLNGCITHFLGGCSK